MDIKHEQQYEGLMQTLVSRYDDSIASLQSLQELYVSEMEDVSDEIIDKVKEYEAKKDRGVDNLEKHYGRFKSMVDVSDVQNRVALNQSSNPASNDSLYAELSDDEKLKMENRTMSNYWGGVFVEEDSESSKKPEHFSLENALSLVSSGLQPQQGDDRLGVPSPYVPEMRSLHLVLSEGTDLELNSKVDEALTVFNEELPGHSYDFLSLTEDEFFGLSDNFQRFVGSSVDEKINSMERFAQAYIPGYRSLPAPDKGRIARTRKLAREREEGVSYRTTKNRADDLAEVLMSRFSKIEENVSQFKKGRFSHNLSHRGGRELANVFFLESRLAEDVIRGREEIEAPAMIGKVKDLISYHSGIIGSLEKDELDQLGVRKELSKLRSFVNFYEQYGKFTWKQRKWANDLIVKYGMKLSTAPEEILDKILVGREDQGLLSEPLRITQSS